MRAIVAAVANGNVIGLNGKMPWRNSDELAHFKQLTMGGALVMGRGTFESLGKPLPGRENYVVSSTLPSGPNNGYTIITDLRDPQLDRHRDVFYIGGARIFKEAMEFVPRMHISWLPESYQGDTFFPQFDFPRYWRIESTHMKGTGKNQFRYTVYERKGFQLFSF